MCRSLVHPFCGRVVFALRLGFDIFFNYLSALQCWLFLATPYQWDEAILNPHHGDRALLPRSQPSAADVHLIQEPLHPSLALYPISFHFRVGDDRGGCPARGSRLLRQMLSLLCSLRITKLCASMSRREVFRCTGHSTESHSNDIVRQGYEGD